MEKKIKYKRGKLKGMFKKAASVAIAVAMVIPLGIAAPGEARADEYVQYYMSNPHAQVHYNEYGFGSWSTGQYYIKTGSGGDVIGRAYCINPEESAPQSGWRDCEIYGTGSRTRHLLYYLPGAYGYESVTKNTIFSGYNSEEMAVIGHLIVAYNRGDGDGNYGWFDDQDKGVNASTKSMIVNMFNKICDLPDPPKSFTAFYIYGPNGYQSLVGNVYEVPNGWAKAKKSSSNTTVTEGNSYYSLAGTTYDVYDKDSKKVGTFNIKADGSSNTIELTEGQYWCWETKAGKGYELNEGWSKPFTVTGGETVEVPLKDTPLLGSVELTKVSSDPAVTTGNPEYTLAGAKYTLIAAEKIGNKYASGATVATLTTDGNGKASVSNLPFGKYSIKEASAPVSFYIDENTKNITINSENLVTVTSTEKPHYGYVEIQKKSGNTGITDGNRCYSLKGAVYTIYAKKAIGTKYKAGDVVTTVTTDENGYGKSGLIPLGSYTVKETKNSPSYMLDPASYDFTLTASNDHTTVNSIEMPSDDPTGIEMVKLDSESGAIAQGGASLAGAEFTVQYYDTTKYSSVESLEANEKPLRTWVLQTKKSTNTGKYICGLSNTYKVSGDEFYRNEVGQETLPIGTIVVEETKAPAGYLLEGKYLQRTDSDGNPVGDKVTGKYIATILQDEHLNGKLTGGNYYATSDVVKRGDITFQKKDEDSNVLAGIPFKITSLDENGKAIESHVVYTDENGYYSSKSEYVNHSENTNAEDGTVCGTWFGLAEDGNNVAVKDDLGALPYGRYQIKELECDANKDLKLVDTVFTVSRDDFEIDLGTYTDNPVPNPEIGTTARDEETGTHYALASNHATIIDTVEYAGLTPKTNYKLVTKLVDKATGEVVDGVEIETTFAAKQESGTIDIPIEFNATGVAGKDVVVYEYLYADNEEVATHEDINDEGQTIHFPEIGTTLTGEEGESHYSLASDTITVVDTVAYKNLEAGKAHVVTGTLYDKATGKPARDDHKQVITAETTFTPKTKEGSVEVTFEFSGVKLEGKTVVAFESVTRNGCELAVHADIKDDAQTVHFPKIGTTAVDKATDTHYALATEDATIVDTIAYEQLEKDHTYNVVTKVMDKETGKELEGFGVSGEVKAEDVNGSFEIPVTFDATELAGKDVVIFEYVYDGDILIAKHEDLGDDGQTVHFPKVGTTAVNEITKNHYAEAKKNTTIIDTVKYENLSVKRDYKIVTKLMDKETGKEIEAAYTESVLQTSEKNGTVDVAITFDATELAGTKAVVFEYVYDGEDLIATHEDINDEGQTIIFPEIRTTLRDTVTSTEDFVSHHAASTENVVLVDTVTYKNLIPNKEHVMTGTLMDKATGKPVLDDNKNEIKAEVKFTPEESDGTVDITFEFPGVSLAGKTVVAFESVTQNGPELAVHADIEDPAQTVSFPKISTNASDVVTKTHFGKLADEMSIIDIVTYEGINVNEELTYVIKGALYDPVSGEPIVDKDGNQVTNQVAFTPKAEADEDGNVVSDGTTGTVEVPFTFTKDELPNNCVVVTEEIYVATGVNEEAIAETESETGTDVEGTDESGAGEEGTDGTTADDATTDGAATDDASAEEGSNEETGADDASAEEETEDAIDISKLILEEEPIAVHNDLTDELQMVHYPEIGTTLLDNETQTHMANADEKVTLTDTVAYKGLKPGETYTVRGTLMDKETNKPLLINKKEVQSEPTEFVPETSEGVVSIEFTFDGSLAAGKSVVAFESVEYDGVEIAVHADIEDQDQTVDIPNLHTTAKDKADGDKELAKGTTVTIVDTVTYENVVPGQTLTFVGVLMDKETKKAVENDGKVVTANATVLAKEANGTVDIEFTFDDSEYVGNDLVVFEKMYVNNDKKEVKELKSEDIIGTHEDLNDVDQTVSIKTTLLGNKVPDMPGSTTSSRTAPKTGDMMIWYFIAAAAIAGGILVMMKKGGKKEAKES